SVRLDVISLRAAPFVELPLGRMTALRLLVDGGVDVVEAEPRHGSDGAVVLDAAFDYMRPVFGAGAMLRLGLSTSTALTVALGADAATAQDRFTIERPTGTEAVLTPWVVHPTAALGLSTRLW